MDHFLFEEVYMGLVQSSDIPQPPPALEVWSDTHSVEEDVVDPALGPLVCKTCRAVLPRTREGREHVKLCVYYNPAVSHKESSERMPTSRKRACAPTDLTEKRTRKRRRVHEFEVSRVTAYCDADGTFFVCWADNAQGDSWEPLCNLVDRDDEGESVRVNAALSSYLRENGLSLSDVSAQSQ